MIHYTLVPALVSGIFLSVTLVMSVLAYRRGEERVSPRLRVVWKSAMGIAIVSWLIYISAFIGEDYSLRMVYETVHKGMPLIYKIASSWSNAGGSLVLFTGIIALSAIIYERRIPGPIEKLKFYMYSSTLALVGIIIAIASEAYDTIDLTAATGIGLNPLLKSVWVYPHPLSTFASYGILVVAAAGVLAGLNSVQALRVGWAILTLGILVGGYWSYVTLGWGGYWAWDPVEVSQLIPWLAAVAAIHAYPISRGLARASILMAAAGVYLSIFTTRAGVSPLHGFATARGGLVAITLTLTIGLLIAAFYLMLRDSREKLRVDIRKPYELGLLLSTVSSIYMFIITYFVLLSYSVLTMTGKIPGVPSGDEAIRIYHPLLAPAFLLLLAATPLATLGGRIGARQAYAVAGAGAVLAVVLAVATALGAVEWSTSSSTATNMLISAIVALGSVAAGSALAATLASMRVGHGILAGVFLIHVLMGLLAVGIAISGPYAYGSVYFEDSRLKLGEAAQLGSIKIMIRDYNYELSEGYIEFYTPYAGRSLIYQVASYTTILMSTVLGDMIERALIGEKKLSEMNLTLPARGVELEDLRLDNVSVNIVDPSQGINITLNGVEVSIANTKLYTELTPTRGNITIIEYKIGGDITISGMPSELENKTLMPNTRINIVLDEPLNLSVRGFNITVYNMTVSMFRLGGAGHAFAVVSESFLQADNITITLIGSLTREAPEGSKSIRIPYHLKDSDIVLYAYFTSNPRAKIIWDLVKSDPDIRKILSDKDTRYSILEDSIPEWCKSEDVLTAIQTQGNIPSHCIGYPPAPPTLHSGARLTLIMEIDLGSKVVTRDVTLRFEANGELQGIKGLVAASLPVATGILGNLYIEVYPSYVSIGGEEFGVHELELFYLHESLENLTTEEAIGVAAIFAAAALYSPDNPGMLVQRAMQDPLSLIIYTLELYQKAKLYNPENSTIITSGILVRYKYIPAIYLVWIPATLMAVIELALAIIRETRRKAG